MLSAFRLTTLRPWKPLSSSLLSSTARSLRQVSTKIKASPTPPLAPTAGAAAERIPVWQMFSKLKNSTVPTMLYVAPDKKRGAVLCYVAALLQLAFWGNIATWVWFDYAELDPETNKYELSSFEKRAAYATGLGAVGLLVASAFLYFPSRRILTLTVTPNARQVQLQTPRMLPFLTPRVRTYNIQDLYLQEPLWTGVGRNECEVKGTAGMGFAVLWVSRRVGARFQGFLLDREGSFWEADGGAKLVDKLFIANK
ncbi:hypothetical protein G7K_2168-t1 [Saitoella complicata NRRL Y-17804]|uniref:Uncharacterized protein n=1 Tax=Saitoella complicata (strain BCRC 22490 / CBS 7301 / JCM 7358 / NBRC 10748 / NRRL Y-17804) TaxID=698492 RepID=A0A0E9NE53_SAICN|nr:hypothetical protein G7K_2168-t1 [Saitoella complicata NRRL Y-17804]